MRIFTRKTLILALILSVVAEGLSIAALFLCSESGLPFWFSQSFHGPAALLTAFFLPDVVDEYASKTQGVIFACIVFTIAWLQWFVLFIGGRFFVGPRSCSKHENTAA